jgi:epoxyqueuosine reductase
VTTLTSHALAQQIKSKAKSLGFDLVGITSARPSEHADYLRQWLDAGNAGTMAYLTQRFAERTDPTVYFPGSASIICVAKNYYFPLEESEGLSDRGKIARYALGDDYHEYMKGDLHELADWLHTQEPTVRTRCAVDTAPLLERELAQRAGIGWIGKNTLVINPEIGSWILLGEILTTLELPTDDPAIDHCGTCTRCIDACPTAAITKPYELDTRRCISYLTIEHRNEIAADLSSQIGDWLYGCDICQDVCPFNRKAPATKDTALRPRFPEGKLNLDDVLSWSPQEYQRQLRRSAMKRVKLPILQRNANIVRQNIKSKR